MRTLTVRCTAACALTVALALPSREALAADVSFELAAAASRSTWRSDYAGGAQARAAVRFANVVALDVVTWEQLARVDRRVNTGLTLGVTGFLPMDGVRPFLRLFAIHQHEEAWVSIQDHPFGTVFGIGSGIRHRAGGGATLGVEIPLGAPAAMSFYVPLGTTVVWFPDATLGPSAYVGVHGGLGVTFDLAGEAR